VIIITLDSRKKVNSNEVMKCLNSYMEIFFYLFVNFDILNQIATWRNNSRSIQQNWWNF